MNIFFQACVIQFSSGQAVVVDAAQPSQALSPLSDIAQFEEMLMDSTVDLWEDAGLKQASLNFVWFDVVLLLFWAEALTLAL